MLYNVKSKICVDTAAAKPYLTDSIILSGALDTINPRACVQVFWHCCAHIIAEGHVTAGTGAHDWTSAAQTRLGAQESRPKTYHSQCHAR
jgi:hypothetical protein